MYILEQYRAMSAAAHNARVYSSDHKKGFDARYQIPLDILRYGCDELYRELGVKFDIVQSSHRSDEVFTVTVTHNGMRCEWDDNRREGVLTSILFWVRKPERRHEMGKWVPV